MRESARCRHATRLERRDGVDGDDGERWITIGGARERSSRAEREERASGTSSAAASAAASSRGRERRVRGENARAVAESDDAVESGERCASERAIGATRAGTKEGWMEDARMRD